AFIDVEYAHGLDELAVDSLGDAHDIARLDGAVDQESEITLDGLERRKIKWWFGPGRLRLGLRNCVENDLEPDQRTFDVQRLQRPRIELAEMAKHGLRADLQCADPSRMKPGWPAVDDLDRRDGSAHGGERRERIRLGVERIGLRLRLRPVPPD